MKVNIQKLKNFTKRFIPVLTALVVLACMVCPAFASGIDYNDLNPSIRVDGENDIVTFRFDPSQFVSSVYGGEYDGLTFPGSFSFAAKEDTYYDIYTVLMPSYLDTYNIPSDTLLSFSFRIECDSTYGAYGTPSVYLIRHYYRDDSMVDSNYDDLGKGVINYQYSGSISIDSNLYDGFSLEAGVIRLYALADYDFTFIFDDVVFTMSVNSAYRAAMMSYDSRVIQEIEKQLAEQGKTMVQFLEEQEQTNEKLDGIINGTPEQNEQADQFRDEMDSAIGDLNNAGDVMSDVPKPEIDVDDLVPTDILAGSDFLTYTATIGEFWNSDILSSFTAVLGGLLLLSYVLFGEKG